MLLSAASALACHASVRDTNLIGHVIDTSTGEHLPGCVIRIADLDAATVTDMSGHYVLRDLKPGSYTVTATFMGYKEMKTRAELAEGKTLELNFNAEPDNLMLDQVVVTGSKSEIKRRESPSLIGIVNSKLLDNLSAGSLADGLDFQPGVRVENNCQNCGFTQVRINGLDGHYSQILMNSRPVFSALAGVYGLEQIPANMIERVEVLRGGGSALFGASAIGGTINIITKEPESNSAEVAHTLTSMGISGALDNNTTFNASVTGHNNNIGLSVYGQHRDRDGYDHNGDGFTEIAQLKSSTIGLRSGIKFSRRFKLSAEYHATHEYRRGGDNLEKPPHEAMVAEQAEHYINGGELTLDYFSAERTDHINLFSALQSTNRKSYYGATMDPNAYGRTTDLTAIAGLQWNHSFRRLWFMPAELVAGAEFSHNYLHDVTIGYEHDARQKVNIYSAYVQNEWRDERWGFLAGVRLDKHSLVHNLIVSPRANVRFNPTPNVNFRLSYSTGFRAPQAYDEDFHVAVVGGERLVTVLAPGLKQERSNSFSASADFYRTLGAVQCNLMAEGFYTDLNDVFALRLLDEPDAAGNAVLERYNGGGAHVGGVNVEARAVARRWSLSAGVTWQQSRYKQPEAWSEDPSVAPMRKMFRTPDVYGYLTGEVTLLPKLRVLASGTLTGPMPVQHLAGSGTPVDCVVHTPAYFDMGLRVAYEIPVFSTACLDLSAGVTNLFNAYQNDFDIGADRDSGYIYGPMQPRSLTVTARLHL